MQVEKKKKCNEREHISTHEEDEDQCEK